MTIEQFHLLLWGVPPTEEQAAFYRSGGRGVNFSGFEEQGYTASLVLAVYDAMNGPVVLVVPKSLEKRVLTAIQNDVRKICRRFKGKETQVKQLTTCIKRLKIASRFLQPDEEPARWVSIGLSENDPIPQWASSKLWTKN